jgi:hypothetical protein
VEFDQSKNVFVYLSTSGKSYFNPTGDPSGIILPMMEALLGKTGSVDW